MKFTKWQKDESYGDPSSPGFKLPGFRLRWVNGKHADQRDNRTKWMWQTVKVSSLPDDLVTYIKNYLPQMIGDGENIYRNGRDLVLAFAPVDVVQKHRSFLDEEAKKALLSRPRTGQFNEGKDSLTVKEYEVSDVNLSAESFKKR